MMLAFLILLPISGGLKAWLFGRENAKMARNISFLTLLAMAIVLVLLWPYAIYMRWEIGWIDAWGASIYLGLDGLSYWLCVLAVVLGLLATLIPPRSEKKQGAFYAMLLWMLAGAMGILLARDLLLFFVCWELMLIPLYFLITVWGGENRRWAGTQFLIFTQASGLLLLLSILLLYFSHYTETGFYSFRYDDMIATQHPWHVELLAATGFIVAFVVKLPIVPVHAWLVSVFEESPIEGLLVGIMLKTGAYGLLRFVSPLFPHAVEMLSPWFFAIGVITVLYGAVLAFSQTSMRRVLAYSTISHMGLVVIGAFSQNTVALHGVVILIMVQGLATGALLLLVHHLEQVDGKLHLDRFNGLWNLLPRAGFVFIFMTLASVGVPGLGNFIGEVLVLLGAFLESRPTAIVAALGLVLGAAYALRLLHRLFFGESEAGLAFVDLSKRQLAGFVCIAIMLAAMGFYPKTILDDVEFATPVFMQPNPEAQ